MNKILGVLVLVACLLSSCATLGKSKVWVCSECGDGYFSAYDAGMCHGERVVVEYWKQ